MMRLAMSSAASALVRTLTARAAIARDRILLTDVQSVDWQSLTFSGERHHIELRLTGRDCDSAVKRVCGGLEDAEFSIPGLIVADIGLLRGPTRVADGSITVAIEALTVSID